MRRHGVVIAAAGRSRRMGAPKALVEIGGRCMLDRILETVQACATQIHDVVVTVPSDPRGAEIADRAARAGARSCENLEPALGLSGSIRAALALLGDVESLLVCPIDAPFFTVHDVQRLVAAVDAGAKAAQLSVDGRPGHPVIFRDVVFPALCAAGIDGGPRTVLEGLGHEVVRVQSDDERVLANLNTPEDVARALCTHVPGSRSGR